MRRLFAIFLLSLLPLQWTYAAVSDYCKHETAAAAQQHPGHHAHKHVDPPRESNETQKGSLDWDCPFCHHSAGAAMPVVMADALRVGSPLLVDFDSQAIAQRAPDNPFRPPLLAGF